MLTALADDVLTAAEIVGIGVAIVAAVGGYLVPNVPAGPARYLKMLVAVLGTAGQAAVPLLMEGGINRTGFILIALAALSAVGVGIIPNTDADVLVQAGHEDQKPRDAEQPV